MLIIDKQQIFRNFDHSLASDMIREGYDLYDRGQVILPPPGILSLAKGSLHIKFGMIRGDTYFYVKHATGFSGNSAAGLPTGDGFIAVYSASTGLLHGIVNDEGVLTDLRTAISTCMAVRAFSPAGIKTAGIAGTGTQARLTIEMLAESGFIQNFLVWGRSPHKAKAMAQNFRKNGVQVKAVQTTTELLKGCETVVTTTPSRQAILPPPTRTMACRLIVAVGSDEPGKQEISTDLLLKSDRLIADSLSQSFHSGEYQRLTEAQKNQVITLGQALKNPSQSGSGLTIVDLTGLAVQDIQIVKSVTTSTAKPRDNGDTFLNHPANTGSEATHQPSPGP